MSKKTILVVDDTDWNRDLLVQLLEEDYTILQAVDGADGVRMAEQHKP
ncbi:MAG: response regulator, partial [Deltaproteobacteria bacterium]|nr:response regulator [Deltaproteobacteria bacterium]